MSCAHRSSLGSLAVVLAVAGCGGGDDGSTDPDAPVSAPASFTAGGRTQLFDAGQCSVVSGGTYHQLMCAVPRPTPPAINMVVQAPPAVGSYDQNTPEVVISVVDPTTGISILCGTCLVVVTATAAPGQGNWVGTFEAASGGMTATGTFDLLIRP